MSTKNRPSISLDILSHITWIGKSPLDGGNAYLQDVHGKWYIMINSIVYGKMDGMNGFSSSNRMIASCGVIS